MDVSVNKAKTHSIINRVRNAIKKLDPSYHLKEQGHICAKEWREIMGAPLDFIWGDGYTEMVLELDKRYSGMTLAEKMEVLRSASKMKIRINHPAFPSIMSYKEYEAGMERAKEMNDAITRYIMDDVSMIKGVSS